MPLYKRKDSPYWWIKIEQNGKSISRSTGTADRKKAQEYHDKLKVDLWDQEKLGAKPRYKWEDAVIRWIGETKHKATQNDDLMHLRWVDIYLRNRELSSITRDDIDTIIRNRLSEGVTNATTNRTLAVIRSILIRATNDWEWIDRHPKIKLLPEPRRRVRWLTHEEASRLIAELPEHLAAMVRFSLETGLRQANVTGLTWQQVDLDRQCAWIHGDQAKARKAIAVPLSPSAVKIIKEQAGKHKEFIFTYNGHKIIQVSTAAWYKALKRAGIADFRWHDLRHTWASWMIQNGCPLHVLQELGGWSSPDMVQKYAHLNSDNLRQYSVDFNNIFKH
jgi:integrase